MSKSYISTKTALIGFGDVHNTRASSLVGRELTGIRLALPYKDMAMAICALTADRRLPPPRMVWSMLTPQHEAPHPPRGVGYD